MAESRTLFPNHDSIAFFFFFSIFPPFLFCSQSWSCCMANARAVAEVSGGQSRHEESLYNILGSVLPKYASNLAAVVVHQPSDHLSELISDTDDWDPTQRRCSCLAWTYSEIQHAALRIVAGLRQRGLLPGSILMTLLPNGIEWMIILWSSILGRYTLCALDPHILSSARTAELQDIFTHVQADAIVVADIESAVSIDRVHLKNLKRSSVIKILLSAKHNPTSWLSLETVAKQTPNRSLTNEIISDAKNDNPDRAQLIYFTSGTTTGKPKGCPRSVRSVLHSTMYQRWGSANDQTSRNLLQTQNFRIIAPVLALGTWAQGGCIVMPGPSFSPSHVLQAIEEHRVRTMLLIPAMAHMLTGHPDFAKTDISSLRTIMIGGDMITRDLYSKVCASFPHREVISAHGMTEGGAAFATSLFASSCSTGAQEIPFHMDISTLGTVNDGVRIRVVDVQNTPIRRNEIGELHFSGPGFLTRYLNDEDPDAFYNDSDNNDNCSSSSSSNKWFKSGDIGMIDSKDRIFILGRKRDIIKRAGVPIAPAAVESCIDTFLGTRSSVLGLDHAVLGQVPVAVVQGLNSARDKENVEEHVIKTFGDDFALAGVMTLQELGLLEWPLNATSKIMKRDLHRLVSSRFHEGS